MGKQQKLNFLKRPTFIHFKIDYFSWYLTCTSDFSRKLAWGILFLQLTTADRGGYGMLLTALCSCAKQSTENAYFMTKHRDVIAFFVLNVPLSMHFPSM